MNIYVLRTYLIRNSLRIFETTIVRHSVLDLCGAKLNTIYRAIPTVKQIINAIRPLLRSVNYHTGLRRSDEFSNQTSKSQNLARTSKERIVGIRYWNLHFFIPTTNIRNVYLIRFENQTTQFIGTFVIIVLSTNSMEMKLITFYYVPTLEKLFYNQSAQLNSKCICTGKTFKSKKNGFKILILKKFFSAYTPRKTEFRIDFRTEHYFIARRKMFQQTSEVLPDARGYSTRR